MISVSQKSLLSGGKAMRMVKICLLTSSTFFVPAVAFAQSAPAAFTMAMRYDAVGRVTGTIAPDPDGSGPLAYQAVRNTYDARGRLVRVESGELAAWQSEAIDPLHWQDYTTFTIFSQIDMTYDDTNRKILEVLSSGGTPYQATQYSYDAAGRLECTANRMNPAVYGSLPSSACVLGAGGSQGPDRITRNVYDAASQLLKVQKAYGITVANGYPLDLQQDYATYTYSANSKQTSIVDANGNQAKYAYDGFDRLVAWYFPSATTLGAASTSDYEAYTYDGDGNRTSLRKRDGNVIGYTYDALNRLLIKDIPGGTSADVYYGYDLNDSQLFARFGSTSGPGVINSYDGFGRLSSSTTTMGGYSRTLTYQYNADGRRTRITHPDGVWFDYTYDGLDRMVSSSWYTAATGSVQFLTIPYDSQGRRSGTYRSGSNTTYGYDAVSRVASDAQNFSSGTSNTTTTFSYNSANQIVSEARSNDAYAFTGYATASSTYVPNGLNQYASQGGISLSYDMNGNLVSNGGTTFSYDVENHLVSASGTLTTTLSYDPLGRLWQTTGASGTKQFVYDGEALVAEYDGTGSMLARYAYGPGVDEPILADGGGLNCSQTTLLHADHQGSIVALANCLGTPVAINSYDDYGVPGSGNVGRFQYTGQAYLPDLGMYYYKARIYSSRLGRFLQTDPIGYGDQMNLYAYAYNDPIDGRDSSGKDGSADCQTPTANPVCRPGASQSTDTNRTNLTSETDGLHRKIGSDATALQAATQKSAEPPSPQPDVVVTATVYHTREPSTAWQGRLIKIKEGQPPRPQGPGNPNSGCVQMFNACHQRAQRFPSDSDARNAYMECRDALRVCTRIESDPTKGGLVYVKGVGWVYISGGGSIFLPVPPWFRKP